MTKPTPDSRRIEYRPLADLRPDPRNPKSHALDVIDESIGRFGYVEPVVIDERTGFIISGHGRTKTLQEMHSRGETPPEGLRVDEKGGWLAPVVVGWASRSDTEASAALISLNRTTELGGWVDDALLELLDDLGNTEDGFAGVGFDESDVEALSAHLEDIRLAESWSGSGSTGLAVEDVLGGSSSIPLTEGQQNLTVTILETHREEFYTLMAGLEWVHDVRDSR